MPFLTGSLGWPWCQPLHSSRPPGSRARREPPPLPKTRWSLQRSQITNLWLQASNALGIGISMVFAPALIHYKPTNGTNQTHFQSLPTESATGANSAQTSEQIKANIDIYMEILAAVSVLLFCLFCAYFPSKPTRPPAPSSAIARTKFLKGIQVMLSNTDVLLACFAYSIPNVRHHGP